MERSLVSPGCSGNGQSELAEVLTGLRRVDGGDVIVSGQRLTNASPRRSPTPGSATFPRTASAPDSSARRPFRDNAVLRQYRGAELSGSSC